jgi:hypothetical protein
MTPRGLRPALTSAATEQRGLAICPKASPARPGECATTDQGPQIKHTSYAVTKGRRGRETLHRIKAQTDH